MGAGLPAPRVALADYLRLEANSPEKREYLRGEVWAMAGGTREHGRLAAALIAAFAEQLRGRPCAVSSSDVRIRVDATDRSTYPDLSVVCGAVEAGGEDPGSIANPVVIVEVLSESTAASDRGEKFAHYRQLASLRDDVLVDSPARVIEVFSRGADGRWSHQAASAGHAQLSSLPVTLDLDALYGDPTRGG